MLQWGKAAHDKRQFLTALEAWRKAAEAGQPEAAYRIGLLYARGEGVTQNVVDAHMWFNLAAARFPANDTRNRTAAVKNRDTVAGEMSSEQLAEARRGFHVEGPKTNIPLHLKVLESAAFARAELDTHFLERL